MLICPLLASYTRDTDNTYSFILTFLYTKRPFGLSVAIGCHRNGAILGKHDSPLSKEKRVSSRNHMVQMYIFGNKASSFHRTGLDGAPVRSVSGQLIVSVMTGSFEQQFLSLTPYPWGKLDFAFQATFKAMREEVRYL